LGSREAVREKIFALCQYPRPNKGVYYSKERVYCSISDAREKFGAKVDKWMDKNANLIAELVLQTMESKKP
jgi:hypothetical protein